MKQKSNNRRCFWCGFEYVGYPGKQRGKRTFCCKKCRCEWLGFHNRTEQRINQKGGLTSEEKEKIANCRRNYGSGRTYEKRNGVHVHRVIAFQILGRQLMEGEVVHHLNKNKRDNRIENLVVCKNQSEHMKFFHWKKGGDNRCQG